MISIEKAKKLRNAIERGISALELDNAEAIDIMELFPVWKSDNNYSIGTRVQYNGSLYECVNNHSSQEDWEPDVSPSLWSEVKVDTETGIDIWIRPTGAHNAYNKGDKVLYKGFTYESLIDGNTWAPDEYSDGWNIIE